jgi:hypothetical protein
MIAEICKNSKEKIRVSVEVYRGHKFIDCRVYFEDKAGRWCPSKKGITLSAETANEVIEALQKGTEELALCRRRNAIKAA